MNRDCSMDTNSYTFKEERKKKSERLYACEKKFLEKNMLLKKVKK